MEQEVICTCGAFARNVSKLVIEPEARLTLDRIWFCPGCESYAPAEPGGGVKGVMADKDTWKAREQLSLMFKAHAMTLSQLGQKLGLAPWSMAFDEWPLDRCLEAIEELSEKPKRKRRTRAQIAKDQAKERLEKDRAQQKEQVKAEEELLG